MDRSTTPENEKFAEIRAGSLSLLAASPLDFAHVAMPCVSVLQCMLLLHGEPAHRLCSKQLKCF